MNTGDSAAVYGSVIQNGGGVEDEVDDRKVLDGRKMLEGSRAGAGDGAAVAGGSVGSKAWGWP